MRTCRMKLLEKTQGDEKHKNQGSGGQAGRLTAVIPALLEAEEGGSLEPRSLRLAWPTW